MQTPSTRREAISGGHKFYFTGKPCLYGHVALRYALGACVACSQSPAHRAATAQWRARNQEVSKASCKASYQRHRVERLQKSAAYYQKNVGTIKARSAAFAKANPMKRAKYSANHQKKYPTLVNERRKAWKRANPSYITADAAKRRAGKAQRTPSWACQSAIRAIYKAAAEQRRCGLDVHVDHAIPLFGRRVSGLHVESNLQIIPSKINQSKSNRFEESP